MAKGNVVRDPTARPLLGQLLRRWRAARGISQLDLALQSGFSARHISFIETGRTQPSREALLVLGETLNISLRERNQLLEVGGYAKIYSQTALDANEMRHIRGVLHFILARHEPYGAIVLDRYSNLLMANAAAKLLLENFVHSSLMNDQPNILRMVFHPQGLRPWIVNWGDVARHLMTRAERDLSLNTDDPQAVGLLAELSDFEVRFTAGPTSLRATDLLLPVHLRKDSLELRIFSAIMTLGSPQDVTLQELRIETFFPADAQSEETLRGLAATR